MQEYLNNLEATDNHNFLKDVSSHNNHRPFLLLGLSLTSGLVGEFGSGSGSTPYLRSYCAEHGREFISYDNSQEWADKTGSTFVTRWNDRSLYKRFSLVLVDHAPGEHRHEAVAILKGGCDIIVVHDSEEGGSGNYMYRKIWGLFDYRININKRGGGAGASMISNKINLHKYAGYTIGGFKIEL